MSLVEGGPGGKQRFIVAGHAGRNKKSQNSSRTMIRERARDALAGEAPHRMQSNRLPLSEYLDTAVTAARAAAAILQAYSHNRAELVIDKKTRNDLVSQADREAEQAIIEILRERTPDLGIVAEESGGFTDRKSTRLNSSQQCATRQPPSA